MDKKPLIGVSICAVVLLVLGSLSNVVGYQSVKSTTVNDSPLFSMRTQRATNQQQNITTSQYLGMGKGNRWQFPTRDNRTEQLNKVIDIISKMDDKTFHRFVEKIIPLISQKENTKDIDFTDIEQALHQLRKNSERFNVNKDVNSDVPTIFDIPICWFPGYILGCLLILIVCIYIMLLPTEIVQCYYISVVIPICK